MDGGRGERRDREGGRQWKGDLGRVQIKKRGGFVLCCVCVGSLGFGWALDSLMEMEAFIYGNQ
jgi:hypothetical protein